MGEAKYGEPWTLYATHFNGERHPRIASLDEDSDGAILHDIGGMPEEMPHFRRIVDCVNALSGIDSPSEWREAVGALQNAAKDLHSEKFRAAVLSAQLPADEWIEFATKYRKLCEALAALERVEAGESNG